MVGRFIMFSTKPFSIIGKACAIDRTLHADKSNDVFCTIRWNSHSTIAEGEIERFDGGLIAEDRGD